jgi:hypothetical protein
MISKKIAIIEELSAIDLAFLIWMNQKEGRHQENENEIEIEIEVNVNVNSHQQFESIL